MADALSPFQSFIFISRYSRWLPSQNRRESWDECVDRWWNYFTDKVPSLSERMPTTARCGRPLDTCRCVGHRPTFMPSTTTKSRTWRPHCYQCFRCGARNAVAIRLQ